MLDYRFTDIVTGKAYFSGTNNNHVNDTLFDADGNVVAERWDPFNALSVIRAGLYPTVENAHFCYRAIEDGSLKFCRIIQSNSD